MLKNEGSLPDGFLIMSRLSWFMNLNECISKIWTHQLSNSVHVPTAVGAFLQALV